MSLDLARLRGEYVRFDTTLPFTAHDAISLAMVRPVTPRVPFIAAYYETAWRALVAALALPHADEMAAGLATGGWQRLTGFVAFEPVGFGTLCRARRLVLDFANLAGGALEGDSWGRQGNPRAAFAAAVGEVEAWSTEAAAQLLPGLVPIDRALCVLMGWDLDRQVDFAVLRDRHGWVPPTSDEILRHWHGVDDD